MCELAFPILLEAGVNVLILHEVAIPSPHSAAQCSSTVWCLQFASSLYAIQFGPAVVLTCPFGAKGPSHMLVFLMGRFCRFLVLAPNALMACSFSFSPLLPNALRLQAT